VIVRRIPGRDALLGPALALGALAAVLLALRGAAQVLPLGVVLACALALVILAPGLAAARVVGVDDVIDAPVLVAIAVPLGCAVWALALMAGIILQLPLAAVAIAVFLFTGVATGRARAHMRAGRATAAWLGGAGLLLAAAASRLESGLHGDELFHAGRVRKLIDLPHLSLSGLSSVWHGSPHAGYVVPVLHAIDAAAIRITGADPSTAYPHLAPGCALLLPIAAYALGAGVGRNAGIATAAFASWDALARSSLESLQQPPEFTFFVLIPAWLGVLAVDARSRQPNRPLQRALLLSLLAITLIHATYAVVPLAALIAVTIVTRRGWRLLAACLSLTGVIYAVIWAVALRGGQHLPGPRVLSTVYLKAGGHPFVAQAHWMLTARPEIALAVLAVLPLMLLFRRRHVIAASVMAGALVSARSRACRICCSTSSGTARSSGSLATVCHGR
jgi:hypothetical protein